MKPDANDRLKVEVFTSLYDATPENPYYDITNDAGDLSNEYSILEPPDKETAHRLVACWNACRGIETDVLEGMQDGHIKRLLEEYRGAAR